MTLRILSDLELESILETLRDKSSTDALAIVDTMPIAEESRAKLVACILAGSPPADDAPAQPVQPADTSQQDYTAMSEPEHESPPASDNLMPHNRLQEHQIREIVNQLMNCPKEKAYAALEDMDVSESDRTILKFRYESVYSSLQKKLKRIGIIVTSIAIGFFAILIIADFFSNSITPRDVSLPYEPASYDTLVTVEEYLGAEGKSQLQQEAVDALASIPAKDEIDDITIDVNGNEVVFKYYYNIFGSSTQADIPEDIKKLWIDFTEASSLELQDSSIADAPILSPITVVYEFYNNNNNELLFSTSQDVYLYGEAAPISLPTSQPSPSFTAVPVPFNGKTQNYISGEYIAPLEIVLPHDDLYYYILLKDFISEEKTVSIFLHPNVTKEVLVPCGTYEMFVACGDTWYGYDHLFGEAGGYSKLDGTFRFYEDREYIMGHTIELEPVSNGNLDNIPIDMTEFLA